MSQQPAPGLLDQRCCISINWSIAMKKLLVVITPLLMLGAAYPAFAAGSNGVQAREAQIQACFRMHGQLMDKPAVRNPLDCWREHGFLMQK
ncbi:MAG: hypothetical protein B7X43_00255 [Thiomonas sp. 15-63-373]|nr:MAG: hypothetical protein B7X43_00255 [Thiomonas sp. 15-63-373]